MAKRIVINILAVFLLSSGVLPGQAIKINRVNLERFPIIRLTLSFETASGAALPVDTRHMEILEGDLPVKNVQVLGVDMGELPVYTVIALDKSGSMKGAPIQKAKIAACEYIGLMTGDDHCAYIEFDTQVTIVSGFSRDKGLLTGHVDATVTGSDTAFLDAVHKGILLLADAPEGAVKIVLALSDGLDNRSKLHSELLFKAANEAGIFIYTIGLGSQVDEPALRWLAHSTNGNYYFSADPETLPDIYKNISTLLHSQLQVEYETLFPMDEKWHSIQIRVPYRGKILLVERQYLSATESRIPTDVLRRIRFQRRKLAQDTYYLELKEKQNRERVIIIALTGTLGVLVMMLVLVLWKRRKKI